MLLKNIFSKRHRGQTTLAVLAGITLLFILSGCFQYPAPLTSDRLCDPAALVVTQAKPTSTATTAEERLPSSRLTLFIWNSFKGKTDGWLTDLSVLSQDHQLLLLQETYLKDDLLSYLDDSRWNWSMATTFRYKTIPTGVLTGSRIAADLHCQLTAMEPWIRLPKGILVSRYPLTDTTEKLVVANVHLINFTINTKAYKDQLKRLQSILLQHNGPLIVAGDFNTWNSARSRLVEKFMSDLQLTPVEFSNSVRSEVFGRKVDHVYYRDMELTSAIGVAVTTSDHNPMAVTFSIPQPDKKPET